MSLRIKKGTKVWGPKAPVARRPGAPPSAPSSARPSVERQSQTPAPTPSLAEALPVLNETPELDQQQLAEPSTTTPPQNVAPEEPPSVAASSETEPRNILKRKESADDGEIISSAPKRQKADLALPRSPSPPQVLSVPVQALQPTQEISSVRAGSPIAEARQDLETSVYPDPEISSGLGASGAVSSGITGIPEAAGLGPAGDGFSSAAQIAQAPQIVQPESDIEQAEPQALEEAAAVPVKKKKLTKRRKFQPTEEGDEDATATLAMQLNAPRRITRRGRKKKDTNGNKRGATPEGAENEQINPSTMKMAELCKDIRIGVKSSNHDMIKQRLLEQKARAKLAKGSPASTPVDTAEPATNNPGLEASEGPILPSGPQMRIVNGQIVLAESSLHLDRHKRAEAENEEMVEVEENEFSHMTTSGTYMKRERAQLWDSVATSTFYQGLAQFGTNFEMISKLLPSRSRRQIKLKFNNEERKNPMRINRILMGKPERIDLAQFEEMSGLKLEEVADIEKERQAIADEHEREAQAREKEKTDADLRKKKEIADRSASARKILASVDEAEEGGSGKENRVTAGGIDLAELIAAEQAAASKGKGGKKSQPKPRKKKNPHARGDGGDVVEVLGTL